MIQLVRIIISFNRYQNVGNNIYIRSMTLWSLMTNLVDVIKYVREYYYFWTRKCSLFQTLFLSSDTPCSWAEVVEKIARGTRTPRAAESAFSFFLVTNSY